MNFGIAPAVSMLNLAASLAHAENTIIFSLHGHVMHAWWLQCWYIDTVLTFQAAQAHVLHAVVAWPGRQVSFKDCCTGTVACFDTAF
jgi:hypothetical protein